MNAEDMKQAAMAKQANASTVNCLKCGPVPLSQTYIALGNVRRHMHPCDGQITADPDPDLATRPRFETVPSLACEDVWVIRDNSGKLSDLVMSNNNDAGEYLTLLNGSEYVEVITQTGLKVSGLLESIPRELVENKASEAIQLIKGRTEPRREHNSADYCGKCGARIGSNYWQSCDDNDCPEPTL